MVAAAFDAPALSPFAASYRESLDAGFHPIALVPGQKAIYEEEWTRWCDRRPTESELASGARKPNANIGYALGTPVGDGTFVILVDGDLRDDAEVERLKSALPASPMERFGSKGFGRFYRAPPTIRSARYQRVVGHREDGKPIMEMIVEVLAHGKQTVVPPSIHPETKRPYIWIGGGIVDARELPLFDEDALTRLEEVAETIGWAPGIETAGNQSKAAGGALGPAGDDPASSSAYAEFCRYTNNEAFDRFDLWVPALGLYKLQKKQGGYRAVATWRESQSKRPLEKRGLKLSIDYRGIKDHGSGETFSALDLVMTAMDCTLDEALAFLWDKTGLAAELDAFCKIEVDKMLERTKVREAAKRGEPQIIVATDGRLHNTLTGNAFLPPPVQPPRHANDNEGLTWDDREANASNAMEWLVKGLVPRVGVSLLWGQSGAGKSFVALHLAARVLSGEAFFGHRVKAAGGTFLALGEGKGSMPDRMNALRRGTFGSKAPKHPETGEEMDLDRFPIVWKSVGDLAKEGPFRAFADMVRRVAAEMPVRRGVPLRLVVVDTMVASFGFPEDPDASAVTKAMQALDGLAQELGICVVAVHHAGKSKQAGEHGSYAWRGSVETSIEVDAVRNEANGAVTERQLYLKKNRHSGNEGWNQPFDLRSVQLGIDDDGDPITSAIIIPIGGLPNPHGSTAAERRMSHGCRRFMRAFNAVFEMSATTMQTKDGDSVMAVMMRDVKDEYLRQNPGEADSMRRRCDRDLDEAFTANLVVPQGERAGKIVWPTDERAVPPETAEEQSKEEAA